MGSGRWKRGGHLRGAAAAAAPPVGTTASALASATAVEAHRRPGSHTHTQQRPSSGRHTLRQACRPRVTRSLLDSSSSSPGRKPLTSPTQRTAGVVATTDETKTCEGGRNMMCGGAWNSRTTRRPSQRPSLPGSTAAPATLRRQHWCPQLWILKPELAMLGADSNMPILTPEISCIPSSSISNLEFEHDL